MCQTFLSRGHYNTRFHSTGKLRGAQTPARQTQTSPKCCSKNFDGPKYRTVPPTRKRKSRDTSQPSLHSQRKKVKTDATSSEAADSNDVSSPSSEFPSSAHITMDPTHHDIAPGKDNQRMEAALALLDFYDCALSNFRQQNADVFSVERIHKDAAVNVKLPSKWGVHSDFGGKI